MRCNYHQDREAIGTCARCGRGVCEACRVLVNGNNVCKGCIGAATARCRPDRKEPLFALVLSFLLPGLGQLYNGDTDKGIMLIIATVVSWLLTSVCIGLFVFLAIWVYAMYDAYTNAIRTNQGLAVPKY